ncbi:MAG: hypothetical protein AAFQ32_16080 [Pseudomonadota bacterium]
MSIFTALGACVASGTALWIAYKVYPYQKRLDRELQLGEEKRRALADLIRAIEECRATLLNGSVVSVPGAPEIATERVGIQKSLALVRAYGCSEIVDQTLDYEKRLLAYRRKLEKLKAKRATCTPHPKISGRIVLSDEYKVAQSELNTAFREMSDARNRFFDGLSQTLGVEVSKAEIAEPNDNEDAT